MSLILEALRKSEAERRRAQAPDLFAPAQVAVAPARRLPLAWVAGGGVLAVALVALLLVGVFGPARESPRPATAAAANDAPADAPASATPPAAAIPTPARPPDPANAAPRLLPAAEEPPAAVVDPPPSEPATQAGNADAAIASIAGAETAEAVPAPEPPTAPAASAPEPVPVADTAAPPMRLSELGGDARRQLPPLKLTMHMWNEAAERRFVILDGRRLAEGDRIGAARVAEIRRDGVILDWNGQRLELPLR